MTCLLSTYINRGGSTPNPSRGADTLSPAPHAPVTVSDIPGHLRGHCMSSLSPEPCPRAAPRASKPALGPPGSLTSLISTCIPGPRRLPAAELHPPPPFLGVLPGSPLGTRPESRPQTLGLRGSQTQPHVTSARLCARLAEGSAAQTLSRTLPSPTQFESSPELPSRAGADFHRTPLSCSRQHLVYRFALSHRLPLHLQASYLTARFDPNAPQYSHSPRKRSTQILSFSWPILLVSNFSTQRLL